MAIFDSIPTKVVKRSPPWFAYTADFAAEQLVEKDQWCFGNPVTREAFAGFIVAVLAIMSDEIRPVWAAENKREIIRLAQVAKERLTTNQLIRAEERVRDISRIWDLDLGRVAEDPC